MTACWRPRGEQVRATNSKRSKAIDPLALGCVARRARLTGQHAGYLEWSSVNRFDRCLSCDLLEFTPRPHAGYFSDVNNQDAKLARDGDFAKAESIAFMDEAIDGELKLFSVADRE